MTRAVSRRGTWTVVRRTRPEGSSARMRWLPAKTRVRTLPVRSVWCCSLVRQTLLNSRSTTRPGSVRLPCALSSAALGAAVCSAVSGPNQMPCTVGWPSSSDDANAVRSRTSRLNAAAASLLPPTSSPTSTVLMSSPSSQSSARCSGFCTMGELIRCSIAT